MYRCWPGSQYRWPVQELARSNHRTDERGVDRIAIAYLLIARYRCLKQLDCWVVCKANLQAFSGVTLAAALGEFVGVGKAVTSDP